MASQAKLLGYILDFIFRLLPLHSRSDKGSFFIALRAESAQV